MLLSTQNLILLGQKGSSNLHSTNMYIFNAYLFIVVIYSQHNYFLYPLKFSAPASKKLVCVRSGAILLPGISAVCMPRSGGEAKGGKHVKSDTCMILLRQKLPNLENTCFCHVLRVPQNTHADVAAVLDDELEHCWSQSHKTRTARSGTQKTFLIN